MTPTSARETRCPNCDGQGRIRRTLDGDAVPSYPWNAPEDAEMCGLCKGTGGYAAPSPKPEVRRP